MSGKTDKKSTHSGSDILPAVVRYAPWLCLAALVSAVFVFLAGVNYDYVRMLEEQSFFMGGGWFFSYCMSEPSGLINWVASFLTQFFYYPWLGAAVIALMLAGLALLTVWAFRLPRSLSPLAGVVPAMMLLFMLMPGYLIYLYKTPGFAFTGILGFAVSIVFYVVYVRQSRALLRLVLIAVYACCYPLFGFFALFGVLLCAVGELMGRRKWWVALVGIVLAAAVPQIWFYCFESHTIYSRLYITGLPRMGVSMLPIMNTYWLSIACLIVLAVLAPRFAARPGKPAMRSYVALGVFVLAFASIFVFRYRNANFSTAITMDLAINEGDIPKALAAAKAHKEKPTRVVDLMTHIALFREGLAGDSLFSFPMADAPYDSPYPTVALRMSAARFLNYHFGRINDSYRWCMEDMVEYGYRVEYLKYMTRYALLAGEYDLARRYLRMLSGTMFHKDWARKYGTYADNPELMKDDPELSTIKALNAFNGNIGGDSGLIELYISTTIAGLRGGPPPLVELSLQFNLVQKNIENFWPRFMLYARTHQRLPRHYQEAAILFSALENKVDWRQFRIDPEVVQRFSRFMDMARKNSRYSDEQNRELFEPIFGDTYWFYYFFVNDLKTT